MLSTSRVRSLLLMFALVSTFVACGGENLHESRPTPTPSKSATVQVDATRQAPSTEPPGEGTALSTTSTFPAWPTTSAAAFDSDDDGALTLDEYQQALKSAFKDVIWPPGYTVTPEMLMADINKNPENKNAHFQPGVELDHISAWLNCAWEQTWLDSRQSGNKVLEAEALDYIVNVIPGQVHDDYSLSVVKSIGQKALLGDPSGVIQTFTASNCAAHLQDARIAPP